MVQQFAKHEDIRAMRCLPWTRRLYEQVHLSLYPRRNNHAQTVEEYCQWTKELGDYSALVSLDSRVTVSFNKLRLLWNVYTHE